VWEAWDERLHRTVALKRLHPQPGLSRADADAVRERAMREARITARLHHANAVQVYDVIDVEGQPCLVMQHLPSRSLSAVLAEQRTLPPDEVARIGAEIGSALAAAHGVGIVHRDVKPGNVLIDENGSAKITDFGISHALGDVTLTSTGMVTGTPAFLAPEVARGERSTPASDVFSLGATLYAALEGQPPFGAGENPMATLHRVASGQMDPPQRSGPLTPLLLAMLAADPAKRPSIDRVVGELRKLGSRLKGEGTTAKTAIAQDTTRPLDSSEPAAQTLMLPPAPAPASRPPAARPPARPPAAAGAGIGAPPPARAEPRHNSRRRWWLLAALAAVVLVGGIIAAVAATSGNTPARHRPLAGGRHSSPSATHPPAHHASHASTHTPPPPATHTRPTQQSSQSSTPPSAGAPTAQQLAAAITDYYQLLPADTHDAWPRMTASYQQSTAQGRGNYNRFWHQFSSVSTSDVTATPPHTVVATITYTRKNGSTTSERTSFGLVRQDGELKINSSYVISSG
jgi:hypothetical protein